MEGFVITGVLEPLNLTWRLDGVTSAIIGMFMHDENHFSMIGIEEGMTEFRQTLQVQSHLEMPRILVQLGHTQRT